MPLQRRSARRKGSSGRRIRLIGPVAAAIAIIAAPAAGQSLSTGADRLAPGEIPKKTVTLGQGRLWGAPWRIVAFHTKGEIVCEGLVRGGSGFNICGTAPQVPDPILVPAGFTKAGPQPTTFAVIAVTDEVDRVEVRLSPGHRTLSRSVQSLSEHESRRSGLPSGFRYALVAVPKVRGLELIRAFGLDGRLVGRLEGATSA